MIGSKRLPIGSKLIVSFKGKAVEAVAEGKAPKGFPPDLVARGERRLRAIENAGQLNDRHPEIALKP